MKRRYLSRKEHNVIFFTQPVTVFECAEYWEDTYTRNIIVYKYFNWLGIIVISILFPISVYKRGLSDAVDRFKNRPSTRMACYPTDNHYSRLMIKLK